MKVVVCLLLVVGLLAGFAVWLGWGRQSTWEQATGWSQLPAEERAFAEATRADIEQRAEAPVFGWKGHATIDVQWGGVRCVVDPVAADRVKVAPRWFEQPRLDVAQVYDVIGYTRAAQMPVLLGQVRIKPDSRIAELEAAWKSDRLDKDELADENEILKATIKQVRDLTTNDMRDFVQMRRIVKALGDSDD